MDVLPLYIMLLLFFPPMLWALIRAPSLGLIGSAALYAMMHVFGWNIPAYPSGGWVFNPFAWQLLFVFGAWCALGGAERLSPWLKSRTMLYTAAAYLAFAFCITLTWYFPRLGSYVPHMLSDVLYPIDKTNLDVLRILHFLALAVVTMHFIPRGWPVLKWRIFRPAILCGQHSLAIFCLGVFLAFAAHFVFTEVSNRLPVQVLVSLAGILAMVATAKLLAWYKAVEKGPKPPPSVRPGLAAEET